MKDKLFSAIAWLIVWWWVVFGYSYFVSSDETNVKGSNAKSNTESTQEVRTWWRGGEARQRWWGRAGSGSTQESRAERGYTGTGWIQGERPARWERDDEAPQKIRWEKPSINWEEAITPTDS